MTAVKAVTDAQSAHCSNQIIHSLPRDSFLFSSNSRCFARATCAKSRYINIRRNIINTNFLFDLAVLITRCWTRKLARLPARDTSAKKKCRTAVLSTRRVFRGFVQEFSTDPNPRLPTSVQERLSWNDERNNGHGKLPFFVVTILHPPVMWLTLSRLNGDRRCLC